MQDLLDAYLEHLRRERQVSVHTLDGYCRDLAKVQALSQTIEAHYVWLEQQLGKTRLTALYDLLDKLIALEVPEPATAETDHETFEE